MPSVSKQQQKFFGLVRALQKGDVSPSSVTKKARDAAKDMKKSDVKKYAATKHKGLPRKVRGEFKVRELIKKMVREILDEQKLKQLAVIRSSQPQSPYTIFQDGNGFVMKGGRGFSLSFKDDNLIAFSTSSLSIIFFSLITSIKLDNIFLALVACFPLINKSPKSTSNLTFFKCGRGRSIIVTTSCSPLGLCEK